MPQQISKNQQAATKPVSGAIANKNQKNRKPSRPSVKDAGAIVITGDELEAWLRGRTLLKPEDQLDLTDDELNEEIARVFTVTNPQLPKNVVQFSFREGRFVPTLPPGNQVVLFDLKGTAIHVESDEAKMQIALEGGIVPMIVEKAQSGKPKGEEASAEEKEEGEDEETDKAKDTESEEKESEENKDKEKEDGEEDDGEKEDGEMEGEKEEETEPREGDEEKDREESAPDTQPMVPSSKKLTNQFNFCERAAQTYAITMRDMTSETTPPPRSSFSDQVMQWTIYDAYKENFEAQEREKEKEMKEKLLMMKKDDVKKREGPTTTERNLLSAKTLERMINQNTFNDIAQDCRYWDDPSDEYREKQGTLLPLWKFTYEKTKKNCVTDICWNPCYYDLFAVSFGSFDFAKQQSEGAVCLYTLKNPSYPEYICTTELAVNCIDIHPKYPHFLAIGKSDGNVAVYDVTVASNHPQYESSSTIDKHGGIVWQIKWGIDMPNGEINFYSVSGDGYVCNWVLTQNELSRTTVLTLHVPSGPVTGPEGVLVPSLGCGTTVAFHPTDSLVYLVGTEEGFIYKCSTASSSVYLATYKAHHMSVTKINYNTFYPQIFISCSADWRVKIWEDKSIDPLFVFDLGCPVCDVEWSPYSSTVFGAATLDGRLHVFDLNVNKYKAICVQSVVSKKNNKLIRMAFNYKLPIIITGDDMGAVASLKLSPNLRIEEIPPRKGPKLTPFELEVQKLERILSFVKEPSVLSIPPDVPVAQRA